MSNIVSLTELTLEQAVQYATEAVQDTSRLSFSKHAKERMIERGITNTQIARTLKQGQITEGPYQDTKGRWTCRFEGYSAGKGLAVVAGFYASKGVRVVVVSTFELRA